jgi:F-type H+-transporting ATPase subunit a
MQETPGIHPLWHIPYMPAPFNTVHIDTVVVTWLAMALALMVLGLLAATHPITVVSKRYSVMELVVGYLSDTVVGILGKKGRPYVPFIISLFLFILLLNEIGLFPLIGRSPTADLNTTAALAVTTILLIQLIGLRNHGLGFYKHLVIKPLFLGIPMLPITLIDELARPVTLAMRLFGNIFAGEVLLLVVGVIITSGIILGPYHFHEAFGIFLLALAFILAGFSVLAARRQKTQPRFRAAIACAILGTAVVLLTRLGIAVNIPVSKLANAVPVLIYAFNLIIGLIQAAVFTLLTIAYLITPTQESPEH